MMRYIEAALHKIKSRKIDMDKTLQARIARGDVIPMQRIQQHEMYRCCVCSVTRNEMFMVHDAVWVEAGFKMHDFACFPCFAQRLKRPLLIEDFMPSIMNEMIFHAYVLGHAAKT